MKTRVEPFDPMMFFEAEQPSREVTAEELAEGVDYALRMAATTVNGLNHG